MTISPELAKKIEQEAEHYANVQHSDKGKHLHHHNSQRWDDSKEDWEAGATEYATKLHESQEDKELMRMAYECAQKERDELQRQNDKLKERATGWRPLLEEVLSEADDMPLRIELIEKIKTFLYGE
jgi:FtsZ-binding cell division protein ZapB